MAWIKTTVKSNEITEPDILTPDEVKKMIDAASTFEIVRQNGTTRVLLHGDDIYFQGLENIYGQVLKEEVTESPMMALEKTLSPIPFH